MRELPDAADAPGYGDVLRRIYRSADRAARPRAFRGSYTRPADNHSFYREVVIMPVGDAKHGHGDHK